MPAFISLPMLPPAGRSGAGRGQLGAVPPSLAGRGHRSGQPAEIGDRGTGFSWVGVRKSNCVPLEFKWRPKTAALNQGGSEVPLVRSVSEKLPEQNKHTTGCEQD
ncbi:hypothetical protein SKAU_G00258010 [Synaphobranchus kaupii]|uniref:Uncharacterized protein n=1 Tax=Synaphobranchus kaupii TaxID=118154 RepID=A0A9Q1F491_SYNKA|nr:hypothetical protein SKAU_G00258010 [Synaphobranchus kaupii]